MARITIGTVPDVALDPLVTRVRCSLRVTIRADEYRVVRRIAVAIAALRVVVRDLEPRVIKGCAEPRRGRVAGLAGCGEPGGHVIRAGGALILHLVARIAIRRRSGEDIVDMAACARNADVRTGQRKRRVVVIEGRARPARGVVAGLAGGGEPRGHVVRVRRRGVIGHVTCLAGRIGQRIVVIHVAGLAGQSGVRARQRETSRGMVEVRSIPVHRRVADRTVRREPC